MSYVHTSPIAAPGRALRLPRWQGLTSARGAQGADALFLALPVTNVA
jgi:hypothetical protein